MSEVPLIRLEGVTKRYGDVTAVDAVSLEIAAGEFFALLGPSGCGKTTLMRLIAGFEAPDEGRVLIDGQDMSDVPAHRRPVNMMFQSYALFPHMSVARNIGFGLVQAGMGKADIAARVEELLRLVQLEGLGSRKPDQLSGGQRQRVALARALARRPRLVLLDEPLAALDRKLREETQFELMRVQRELGTGFMLVTHDQDEAMVMAHRIAVMRAGRIEQIGVPRSIYEEPASRFVAGFIGDVNLFEGSLEKSGDGRSLFRFAGSADVIDTDVDQSHSGRAVLAVRPERMRLLGEAGNLGVGFPGTVLDAAYRGDTQILRVRLTDGTTVRVARFGADVGEDHPRGSQVRVGFAPRDGRVLVS